PSAGTAGRGTGVTGREREGGAVTGLSSQRGLRGGPAVDGRGLCAALEPGSRDVPGARQRRPPAIRDASGRRLSACIAHTPSAGPIAKTLMLHRHPVTCAVRRTTPARAARGRSPRLAWTE